MKNYEKFFSTIFITVMFACIFLRIESWPFSDWRVYSHHSSLKHVNYFIVSHIFDGKKSEPFTGSGFGIKVSSEFNLYSHEKDKKKLHDYCDKIYQYLVKKMNTDEIYVERVTVSESMDFKYQRVCSRPNN